MPLNREDVLKIAHLARLAIDEEAVPKYARELSNILEFVEQMNQVDTKGILPMAHPQALTQRLRPDEITEKDQRELFQKIAPSAKAGLYIVPKVIE